VRRRGGEERAETLGRVQAWRTFEHHESGSVGRDEEKDGQGGKDDPLTREATVRPSSRREERRVAEEQEWAELSGRREVAGLAAGELGRRQAQGFEEGAK
jgi:hypothetical protein